MTKSVKHIPFSKLVELSGSLNLSRSKYLGRLKVTIGLGGESKTIYGSDFINKMLKHFNHDVQNRGNSFDILLRLKKMPNPKPETLIARICQKIARLFSRDALTKLRNNQALARAEEALEMAERFANDRARIVAEDEDSIQRLAEEEARRAQALQTEQQARAHQAEEQRQEMAAEAENNRRLLDEQMEPPLQIILAEQREAAIRRVTNDGFELRSLNDLRNDRQVVLAAVRQNGMALIYANEEHRDDREVVLEATRQNGLAILAASEELKRDRDFILAALRKNRWVFAYIDPSLQADPEIATYRQPITIAFLTSQQNNLNSLEDLRRRTENPLIEATIDAFMEAFNVAQASRARAVEPQNVDPLYNEWMLS